MSKRKQGKAFLNSGLIPLEGYDEKDDPRASARSNAKSNKGQARSESVVSGKGTTFSKSRAATSEAVLNWKNLQHHNEDLEKHMVSPDCTFYTNVSACTDYSLVKYNNGAKTFLCTKKHTVKITDPSTG